MDVFARPFVKICLPLLLALSSHVAVNASDWPRFRGPDGLGISHDKESTPVEWSESKNLKWKVALPGPGSSSPILLGDRVWVTCWTGYGADRENLGDQKDLKRHLICIDRNTGKTVWSKAVDAVSPEDPYQGMFTQHGYASHTPVSDGKRVYVFFGKTGVLAFDLDGNQLWQTSVGTGSDPRGWGTASSPILYKNLVIVTAAVENQAMVALNKETGEEVWKQNADSLSSTWSTPVLADAGEGRIDLVVAVPYEIWGFNPETGKFLWYCESYDTNSLCTSPVARDGIVYVIGGISGGSIAVRAGGTDDVTKTHVVWSGQDQSRISTPICYDGRLYWIASGIANCADAKTGQRVYQARLERGAAPDDAGAGTPPGGPPRGGFGQGRGGLGQGPGGSGQGRGGFGGFGRGGGGFGGQDYSSPVVADGKLYFVSRSGETFVLALGPTFQQLGRNRFESDGADFSATPALSKGDLFIRSSKNLYCVAKSD